VKERGAKILVLAVGLVSAIIAIVLAVLLATIVTRAISGSADRESAAIIASFIAPFVLFFASVTWGVFARSIRGKSEMFTIVGWRILAGTCFSIGLLCAIFGGPISLLLPLALSIVLLMQEEWVKALFMGGH